MSRKLGKVVLIAGLLAAGLLNASSATANWTTNGGGFASFTADASKLAVTPVGGAVQGISCPRATLQVFLLGGSFSSGNAIATQGSPAFQQALGVDCRVVGQIAAVSCGTNAAFNATSYNPVGGVTMGSLTGVSCVIVKTSGACGNATTFTGGGITVTGSVTGTYGNTTQQLTVNTAGQSLSVSWSSTGCLQGTGTGTATGQLTNSSGTALVYSATGFFRMNITN
jgi:hypothetical protein